MTLRDLSFLAPHLQSTARRDGGEVCWPLQEAAAVMAAIAASGSMVVGLDAREYEEDGTFFEWPLISVEPASVGGDARRAADTAAAALARVGLKTNWILITWV